MNNVSIFSKSFSVLGNAFYAHAASRGASEEKSLASVTDDTHEVAKGIFDTLTGIFIKAFPQTFFTLAFTMQLHDHLKIIHASQAALTASKLVGRVIPALPFVFALAPLWALTHLGKNKDATTLITDGMSDMKRGRIVQKIGNYMGRVLEIAYAALLISRIIKSDGRIEAIAGIATLIAGLVYRYDLLKKIPPLSSLLAKVFTWQPSYVPYILGGSAIVAGPTRIIATMMLLGPQLMRDLVLVSKTKIQTQSHNSKKTDPQEMDKHTI